MRKYGFHLVVAGVMLLGLGSSRIAAQPASTLRIEVPPIPQNLQVPAGHSVFLKGFAAGTQNYICLQKGSGLEWKFIGPQATLFVIGPGRVYQQIATHFLAANPAENGELRPSWQQSFDTSQVWGRAKAASSDPAFVQPGAVAWLLVERVGAQVGPSGGSLLANTTFIHRLNTSGGVEPVTGCTEATHVGAMAFVPYTTDYYFYRSNQ